ncbi:MAG: LicD family protein [Candidatus Paceibacterota bacterium]
MVTPTTIIKTEDIAELRKIQLRILNELDRICKKNNLVYWLDYGTLLGAVRNGKFIPWDDDIDVSMPMKDYREFLKIAEAELPKDIFLQTPKTDSAFKQYFTKLRDCHSTFIETHEERGTKYHQGIFIDIFPSVEYPKMPRLFQKVLMFTTVRSRYKAVVNRKNIFINFIIYGICKFIWLLLSPLKKYGYGMTPEDNGYMFSVPLQYLYPIVDVEFEGKMYPAPNNYHEHLATIYGKSYMTPPPETNRVPHAKLILTNTPCNHPRAIHRTTSSNQT